MTLLIHKNINFGCDITKPTFSCPYIISWKLKAENLENQYFSRLRTKNVNLIEMNCSRQRLVEERCFMGTIFLSNMVKCAHGRLNMEIIAMYLYWFGGLGLIGISFNADTIAPKIVLFDLKFTFPQSRTHWIIILDLNTFERWWVFVHSHHTKQEPVQNWVMWMQLVINLNSLLGLLEYYFVWYRRDLDGYFNIYSLY